MATIRLDDDTLHVELSGLDPLWAVHGSFAIPLPRVAGASTTKPPSFWSSLKLIGTNAPPLKMAGTFLYHGETVFFDYRGNEDRVLTIDLTGGTYRHLFVHVDDPEGDAARISAALAGRSAA